VQEQYHYATFATDRNRGSVKKIIKNYDKHVLKECLYQRQRVALFTYGEVREMLSPMMHKKEKAKYFFGEASSITT